MKINYITYINKYILIKNNLLYTDCGFFYYNLFETALNQLQVNGNHQNSHLTIALFKPSHQTFICFILYRSDLLRR